MCPDERGAAPLRSWDVAELAAVGSGVVTAVALGAVAAWRLAVLVLGAG